ncbi:V-set domain-containing T-cell activation inhibitor 1-like [Salarias fasciatus]|uniref:V-set domain-containing T-cell activation inhibitor 1-like n=1 Tax=Salarias fasciatus TaxID=181472 RepID=UPI001176E7C5|nr:V-set domain-containing T-cell activation inhibitor 1-like [Salarias fasciatus]
MDLLPALCLCLLICSGAAFSHQTGSEVIRKIVKEDQDALLSCALDGRNIAEDVFDWKTDGSSGHEVFVYDRGRSDGDRLPGQDDHFKDRVFHFPEQLAVGNASIVITKTQVTDSGNYTCYFPFHEPRRRAQYELIVEYLLIPRKIPGAAQQPFIAFEKTNDRVLLQCDVEGAFPKPRVEWRDSSGNVLPAEATFTQKDKSFEVSLQATVTKSGKYQCVATQEEIHNEVFTEIYVAVPGAASEPYITNLKQVEDRALLQCLVKGASPKPAVFWKDDSGNIIKSEEPEVTERGGSYDIVLQTTVTKTDYYHCEVTQKDINHRVSAKIHVFIEVSDSLPIGWIVLGAVVVLVGAVAAILFHNGSRCNKGSRSKTRRSENSRQLPGEQFTGTEAEAFTP